MKKFIQAKTAENKTNLFESSLGRIWPHVQSANINSIAILTSWRQGYSQKDNEKRFSELKNKVRELGNGFVTILGKWKECQDSSLSYKNCPEEKKIDIVEPALFIIGIEKKQAVIIGTMYEQDAIVYAGPETKGNVVLIFNDGSQEPVGNFKPQAMSQAYTELLKNKHGEIENFTFEGMKHKTQNYLRDLIEEELSKKTSNY